MNQNSKIENTYLLAIIVIPILTILFLNYAPTLEHVGKIHLDSFINNTISIFSAPFLDYIFTPNRFVYGALYFLSTAFFLNEIKKLHGPKSALVFLLLPEVLLNLTMFNSIYMFNKIVSCSLVLWCINNRKNIFYNIPLSALAFLFRPITVFTYMVYELPLRDWYIQYKKIIFLTLLTLVVFLINYILWGNALLFGEEFKWHFLLKDFYHEVRVIEPRYLVTSFLNLTGCFLQVEPNNVQFSQYASCNPEGLRYISLFPLLFIVFNVSLKNLGKILFIFLLYLYLLQDINFRYFFDFSLIVYVFLNKDSIKISGTRYKFLIAVLLIINIVILMAQEESYRNEVAPNFVIERSSIIEVENFKRLKCEDLISRNTIRGIDKNINNRCYFSGLNSFVFNFKGKGNYTFQINTDQCEYLILTIQNELIPIDQKTCSVQFRDIEGFQIIKIHNKQTNRSNFTTPSKYLFDSIELRKVEN